MASFSFGASASVPGISISASSSFSASMLVTVEETAVHSDTTELIVALDVSEIKAIVISSNVQVTLKTNDADAPDDTIVIKAGVPYIWNLDSYHALLLTDDVTSIFVVNATLNAANIKIAAVVDSTP